MRLISLVFIIVCCLPGCSTSGGGWDPFDSGNETPGSSTSSPKMGAASGGSEQLPLKIKIENEVNDGKELHILASVKAHQPWPASDVAARLSGLRDGKEVVHSQKRLSELLNSEPGASLVPGKPVNISLSIPSQNLTDYQVELLWGEALGGSTAVSAPASAGANMGAGAGVAPGAAAGAVSVSLHNLHVEASPAACSAPPCGVSFEISGDLINRGSVPIESMMLGVGFVAREGGVDLSARIPENEELVEVSGLQLTPGAKRPVHLVIDRPLSLEQADKYRPVVRIVEVNQ